MFFIFFKPKKVPKIGEKRTPLKSSAGSSGTRGPFAACHIDVIPTVAEIKQCWNPFGNQLQPP